MKKLFYLLALLGIFAVGCEELASGLSNGGDQTENPDNGNNEGDVVDFDINVDDNIIVGFEGGEVEVTITTSLEYSVNVAEEAGEWLSVTKASAEGVDTLTLTVAANEAEQERSAEVTLSVDTMNYSCSFTITQLGWGDDIWKELGEGLFYEDFISQFYGDIVGNAAPVAIEESITRPGYYRMVDPFCEENMPIFLGGIPSDITYAEVGYVEIDARNPEAVLIPFQPVGITINGFGEIWIGHVSEERGEMVDGNISFPMNGLGILNSEGQGYYANTSGLFQIVLPGAPNNAKLRLPSPSLSIENVTDTSFTVTWKAVENADYYVVDSNVADETIVYDTFYTVDVPRKGVYTVNVHAVSDNPRYVDSSTISIVQFYDLITPEECDWAEAKIIVDPENGVSIFCKGTGIVRCKMALFSYDGNNTMDYYYSASELFLWSYDYGFDLAEVNAGGNDVNVGTEVDSGYQAYIFMTHEGGDTVLFKLLYNPANS